MKKKPNPQHLNNILDTQVLQGVKLQGNSMAGPQIQLVREFVDTLIGFDASYFQM